MFRAFLLSICLAATAAAAELTLLIEPRWQENPLTVPSAELVNTAGQSLRVTRLSALVSDVVLVRADGVRVALTGRFGFLEASSGRLSLPLGDVEPGDYIGLEFAIGLPAEVNHADPARWPADHPLNPVVNRLHWSWQGGYVFLALEGKWSAGGLSERGFSYHIAGDGHAMPVRFACQFRVDASTTVKLALDVSRILRDRMFAPDDGSETTHSAANDTSLPSLMASVARSFFWLETVTAPVPTPATGTSGSVADARGAAHPLAFNVPAGFPTPALPSDNGLTLEGEELGRLLFADRRLSGNGTQSCLDCHDPARAFSASVALSRGAEGSIGVRNAMPLFNLAWASAYAWDGSKPKIRDQALAAMTNPIEMNADALAVVVRLSADDAMRERFRAAFGTAEITAERIGLALEQYLLLQVSADSTFDRALAGKATLTEQEKEGFALFMTEYDPARGRRGADCFHCHGGPLFSDYDYKNNGLAAIGTDKGRATVTGSDADAGKFKTPSLRNVALTAPYMHDGRFATIEDVVAHYDHAVERSRTLDPNLAKHPTAGLQLTSAEQQALVAFLKTLTDSRWSGASLSR